MIGFAAVGSETLFCEKENGNSKCGINNNYIESDKTEIKNNYKESDKTETGKFVPIMSRTVSKIVESREQDEGMGARVRRSIGNAGLRNLDPFLMLDEFRVKKPAGFPDHPHRGFETVSTLLSKSKRNCSVL